MIYFFCEDLDFKLKKPNKTRSWIKEMASEEGFSVKGINYIFCSDAYLLAINRQYLQHDYYTDIITFDNSEEEGVIEADIFISIERVGENAQSENVAFEQELRRVLAHGVLHLCGYDDHSEANKEVMRGKENFYLHKYN